MGGKALKYECRRYLKDEYFDLIDELKPKIQHVFNTKIEIVKAYNQKETFGDMDILILNNDIRNINDKIREVNPNVNDIHHNGNVYSFDYKDLQIDLILTKEKYWDTSIHFYSYNDLGNLIGRLYHKIGLSFGFDGLKYIYRIDDKKLGEIIVSTDMNQILSFIGLSWTSYQRGFDSLIDIFEYVASSNLFNRDSFDLTKLNSVNKKRNERRPTFQKFVSWLETNQNVESKLQLPVNKIEWMDKIDNYFSNCNLRNQIKELNKKEVRIRERHNKFNGNLVIERYPNLIGPKLGDVMGKFIAYTNTNYGNFDQFIIDSDPDKIWLEFKSVASKIIPLETN